MTEVERVQTAVLKLTSLAEHRDMSQQMVLHAARALHGLEDILHGMLGPEARVDAIRVSIARIRRLSRRLQKTRPAIDPSLRDNAAEILAILLPLAPEAGDGASTGNGIDEAQAAEFDPPPAPQQEWPPTKILPKSKQVRPRAEQESSAEAAMPRTAVLPAYLRVPEPAAPASSPPAVFEITAILPKSYRPRLAALELAMPPPILVPAVVRPILPLPPTPKKRRPRPTMAVSKPGSTSAVRAAVLGLDRAYRGIWSVLGSRLSTCEDLGTAEMELVKSTRSLSWMGPGRVESAKATLAEQASPYDRMITSLALAHAGVPGSGDHVLMALSDACRGGVAVEKGTLAVNHLGESCIDLRAAFASTTEGPLKAMLVPVMVERGLLGGAELDRLVSSTSDEVASQAAQALAWIGDRAQGGALLRKARSATSPERANAFLFGAVALGEYEALPEVKARLAQGEDPDPLLLDALAIGGDESDALWLAEMATHVDEHAERLLATASALGAAQLHRRFTEIQADGAGRTAEVIRALFQGSMPEAARFFKGEPWSVQSLLRTLDDPDMPLALRRRCALELSVRIGKRPPRYFPKYATAKEWPQLASAWTTYFGRYAQRLSPGKWYYAGQPSASPRLG